MDCIVPGSKPFDDNNDGDTPGVITKPVRHADYYFEDGTLVIQVENILFNVFRSTFTRHSRVFRDIFSLPRARSFSEVAEGSSDSFPVHFPGITCVDFERLLWILYPLKYGVVKAHTAEEWISILHLATRWEFDDIRTLAIREIQQRPISPVKIICLSREFDILSPWTLKAYTALCDRAEALTVQEASELGLPTAVRVSQLRERLRRAPGPGRRSSLSGSSRTKGPATARGRDYWVAPESDTAAGAKTAKSRTRVTLDRASSRHHSDSARLVAETFGFIWSRGASA